MSLVDKPFKEAIRNLPSRKLSWSADRRTKKMIRYRVAEMEGRLSWFSFFEMLKKLVAVPVALVVLMTSTGGYAYYSPTVVRGDVLYSVKAKIEEFRYPREGTSEERITFHLWLSDRRYDEVNEILSRLGKAPVSFIPAARAADASDVLGQVLLETLQTATQHVDYAFLISDEIRDVEKVRVVKEQIKGTLEKQKTFLEKSAPLLKEVKLQETRKSRVKKLKPRPVVEVPEKTEFSTSLEVSENTQDEQIVQNAQEVQDGSLETEIPVVEEEVFEEVYEAVDLDDAGSFIEDRLSFQNELLQKIDDVILEAQSNGKPVVRLVVVLEPLVQHEVATNGFFKEALTVHYQNSKKILESELLELDSEILATEEVSIEENQKVPENSDVPLSNDEDTTIVTSDKPVEPVVSDDVSVPPEIPEVALERLPTEEVLERALTATEAAHEALESSQSVLSEVLPEASISSESSDTPVSLGNADTPSEQTDDQASDQSVEIPKGECEVKAEETCKNSDQKCLERAEEQCEDQKRKEQERQDLERLNRERSESMKKELEELQRKVEQLQSSLRNSAPERPRVSEEIKADLMGKKSKKE